MSEPEKNKPKVVIHADKPPPKEARYRRERFKSTQEALSPAKRKSFMMMAITVVILLSVVVAFVDFNRLYKDRPIARLVNTRGEVGLLHSAVKSKSAEKIFHKDVITVGKGSAEVHFDEPGAVFTLLPDSNFTVFEFDGSRQLRLMSGGVDADLDPQPAGVPVLLSTRDLVVKAPGGRFEVRVEDTLTELRALQGNVEVRREDLNFFLPVKENHVVRMTSNGTIDGPKPLDSEPSAETTP